MAWCGIIGWYPLRPSRRSNWVNDEFCIIKNDEFCIENDAFAFAFVFKMLVFALNMCNLHNDLDCRDDSDIDILLVFI